MIPIKFGTDGWRAIIAEDYTVENVARVASATAAWIIKQNDQAKKVVIGYDCRFGGKLFAETTARIMADAGIHCYLHDGFVTTPMVSLATRELGAAIGIVITASHNPPSYNGFKLKSHFGGPSLPATISEVEALVPEEAKLPASGIEVFQAQGLIEFADLEKLYEDQVRSVFDLDLIRKSGIRIAYDAMYGAGQRILPAIIPDAELIHCEYNPSFYGQAPEPIARNLAALSANVAASKGLHAGLATDGDADRIGMVDENGHFVDAHHVILLLIHYLHKYKGMTGKVVVAFSASVKVRKLCEAYGLPLEITKIGFKHICGHMVSEDVLVGGEESGGIAVKGHIPERDGIWDGLLLLEFMARTGKPLSALVKEVYEVVGPFAYDRNDMHLTEEEKQAIIRNCSSGRYNRFGSFVVNELQDLDGWKYFFDNDTTLMIRPSGTEPVLRVYAEGPDKETVALLLKEAGKVLG